MANNRHTKAVLKYKSFYEQRYLCDFVNAYNVEIVSKYTVTKYYIRYLRKVKPIILVNLSDGLEIQGESTASDCELHESLHERILEMAVMMALQSKGYNSNNKENR